MEVEMMEDDVFFAELSKRISLLITDDEEADFAAAAHFPTSVTAPVPGFSLAHVPTGGASMLAPPAYTLYHHAASYNGISAGAAADNAAAAARMWQQQQPQCGSKGTGVFIPRSSPGSAHHRKKGKSKGASAANKAAAMRAQAAGALPAKKQPSQQ
ncbi:hypothetical protein GUJ93_ZPchr0005g14540 [Zizania palustris]|uniref:Uncharacterized protein n=1 Tax=Zizania palustris TaxID=103762 RepID=A0A8J5T9L9_ZIZPA|nr:hypothetical protein GUJ93_ZPchr0005g14540 [Zizania palustris]